MFFLICAGDMGACDRMEGRRDARRQAKGLEDDATSGFLVLLEVLKLHTVDCTLALGADQIYCRNSVESTFDQSNGHENGSAAEARHTMHANGGLLSLAGVLKYFFTDAKPIIYNGLGGRVAIGEGHVL